MAPGPRILDPGSWAQDPRPLDPQPKILDAGPLMLNSGFGIGIPDTGWFILDPGSTIPEA